MKEIRIPLPRALREVLAKAGYVAELVSRRDDDEDMREIDERNLRAHVAGYEADCEPKEESVQTTTATPGATTQTFEVTILDDCTADGGIRVSVRIPDDDRIPTVWEQTGPAKSDGEWVKDYGNADWPKDAEVAAEVSRQLGRPVTARFVDGGDTLLEGIYDARGVTTTETYQDVLYVTLGHFGLADSGFDAAHVIEGSRVVVAYRMPLAREEPDWERRRGPEDDFREAVRAHLATVENLGEDATLVFDPGTDQAEEG